jgi:hypothetical protein
MDREPEMRVSDEPGGAATNASPSRQATGSHAATILVTNRREGIGTPLLGPEAR